MAQRASGLYGLLRKSWAYEFVQKIMGGSKAARDSFAQEFIRPFPGCRILDIGCGPARILDSLPDVDYYGIDFEESYIADATVKYQGRGHFFCGKVDEAPEIPFGAFDIALANAVLHHLDDGEARALFSLARKALKPAGRFVALDNCFISGQNPIARFLIKSDRGKYVRTPEQYSALARETFPSCAGQVRHKQFPPYTYWIMECVKDA